MDEVVATIKAAYPTVKVDRPTIAYPNHASYLVNLAPINDLVPDLEGAIEQARAGIYTLPALEKYSSLDITIVPHSVFWIKILIRKSEKWADYKNLN